MSKTLYMVIENFKHGDAVPVYRRFREQGRLAPAGLTYVSSWVSDKLDHCYQLMETEDRVLLDNGWRIGATSLTSKSIPSSARRKPPKKSARACERRQRADVLIPIVAGGEGCARCQPRNSMEMSKQDSPGLTNANRGSSRQGGRDHGERPRHLSIRRQISPKKNQDPRQHGNRKSSETGPRPTGSIVATDGKAVQDHKTASAVWLLA